MNNNNINDDDYIRPPDSVRTERLIDYNRSFTDTDLNSELNTVIETSKNEYNLLQEQQQESRQRKFHNIKIQISKLILFDRPNLRYYELILTIIEMFELCLINQYNMHENEYINICKILKSIRLPNNEIEEFKKIIIYI